MRFQGINIVCVGDFGQLPPVCETKLFARWKPTGQSLTTRGQKKIKGRLLWLSIQTVVILVKQCRQTGEANTRFVELLSHLRDGSCTNDDFKLLNSRLIDNCDPQLLTTQGWTTVPIIVSDNAAKDSLNVHAVQEFTHATGQTVHWYHAEDSWKGNIIQDPNLIGHLRDLSSGKTGQMLGRLPLVLGMHIYILHNFNVVHGIANGTTGILRHIRYKLNTRNEQILTSCIIKTETSGDCMPWLHLE